MEHKITPQQQKKLVDKYEKGIKKKPSFSEKKEMYLKQTDRNYKDGDKN